MLTKIDNKKLNFIQFIFLYLVIFSQFFVHTINQINYPILICFISTLILCFPNYRIKLEKNFLAIIGFLCLILIYCLYLQLLHLHWDVYLLGRIIRCLTSVIVFQMIIYKVRPSIDVILKMLIFSILLHSFFIFLQIIFPNPMLLISADYVGLSYINIFLGKDNILISGRGFGLSSSFDMAGIINIIGMIICHYMYHNKSKTNFFYLIFIFIFYISGFFTGRTFMVIGSLLMVYIIIFLLLYGKNFFQKLFVFIITLLICLFLVFGLITTIILPTIDYLITGDIPHTGGAGIDNTGYYYGSLKSIIDKFQMPTDLFSILLGGEYLRDAHGDSGILKLLFSTGLIGLLLHYLFYFELFKKFKKVSSVDIYRNVVIPFFIILLIFDIKYIVLLSRGLFEFLILLLITSSLNNENRHNS